MLRSRCSLALALLAACVARAASAHELPPEHACPAMAPAPDAPPGAATARVYEGQEITRAELVRLAALFPAEVWRHRDTFLPDGMRMTIGACHRRYPPPRAYREATERFAGRARLDEAGNLHDHRAGVPFPIAGLDLAASDAGARIAWDFERRHRGAGPSGRFRLTDLPAPDAEEIVSAGSWFQVQLAQRADLAATDYRATEVDAAAWMAGGRFDEPARARGLAWRQTRALDAAGAAALPDEVLVYVPSLRKVRRAATAWVDGLYLPRYAAASAAPGAVIPVIGGGRGSGGAVAAPGATVAITEAAARGFTGLAIRPNAYAWRVLGAREVLAPLNAARAGYPGDPARSFGRSGLSLASDRWDVRQALVIQGELREPGGDFDGLTLYVDAETLQPLFVITARRGTPRVGVGILLHRWSGDLAGYPAWPDGEPAAVFDPAAAVFLDERDGSGWRRESYDAHGLPLAADEVRYRASSAYLERTR